MSLNCFAYPAGIEALHEGADVGSSGEIKALIVLAGAVYNPADLTLNDVHGNGAYDAYVNGVKPYRAAVVVTGDIVGNEYIVKGVSVTFPSVDDLQNMEAVVLKVEKGGGDTDPPLVWLSGGTPPKELPKQANGTNLTVNFHATQGFLKYRVA